MFAADSSAPPDPSIDRLTPPDPPPPHGALLVLEDGRTFRGHAFGAVGETFGWSVGLARLPAQAKAFYGAIAVATILGGLLNFTPIDPIKALFWSAVINGVVAAPVMVTMMLMTHRSDIMGGFVLPPALRVMGWLSTAVMAVAAIGMLATL